MRTTPTSHADIVRAVLTGRLGTHEAVVQAMDALDALVAERDEALENVRVREASQIPMIPRAAQELLEAAEAEARALREALIAWWEPRRHTGDCHCLACVLTRKALDV